MSRFGGDEFALLCEGVEAEAAERIASRIAEVISAPFVIDGNEVSLSASTGIVLTSDPEVDLDRLMSDADLAMYAAKQDGGARHAVFGQGTGSGALPLVNCSKWSTHRRPGRSASTSTAWCPA